MSLAVGTKAFKVDPEFKEHVLPQAPDENQQLEKNILSDGCRDPLVVWSQEDILLDGHHRYEICSRHNIPFNTEYKDFSSREDALDWVILNQLGRRNLTPESISYLRGKLYLREKKEPHRPKGAQSEHLNSTKTSEKIAGVSNVGQATVRRDAKFAQSVDELAKNVGQEIKSEILSHKTKLKKTDVVKLAKEDKETQKQIVKEIKTGESKSVSHAIAKKKEKDKVAAQIPAIQKPKIYNEPYTEFLKRFDLKSVDLLITDPPYMTDVDDIESFAQTWLSPALSRVKDSGRAYIFIGAYPLELSAYLNALNALPLDGHIALKDILVWTYKNTIGPKPTHTYKQNWQAILYFVGNDAPPLNCNLLNEQFSVHEINAPDGRLGNRYFKWQKPDQLAERLIKHGSAPNDTVIDPFAGSGSFLIAAGLLGRIAFGSDNDADVVDIAISRGVST